MSDHDLNARLVMGFTLGIALLVWGSINAFLGSANRFTRLLTCGLSGGIATLLVWLIQPQLTATFAWGSLALLVAQGLIRSAWVGSAACLLARPRVGWSAVALSGMAILGLACLKYDLDFAAKMENDWSELRDAELGLLLIDSPVPAQTDWGTAIHLKHPSPELAASAINESEQRWLRTSPVRDKVIRRGPADTNTNCHGYVFAAGRYIIPGSDVDAILSENGYTSVERPGPGDVVVYRGPSREVTHTALVRATLDDGTILVEGKWGFLGIFLHDVNNSCYGKQYSFHRTDRLTHVVEGAGEIAE